jgi:hypothetical protein
MDLLTTAEEAISYFNNGTPIHSGSELANEMHYVPGKLRNIHAMLAGIKKLVDNNPNLTMKEKFDISSLVCEARHKILS